MNPSSNFSSYRSSLKAALWRAQSAMEERERVSKETGDGSVGQEMG